MVFLSGFPSRGDVGQCFIARRVAGGVVMGLWRRLRADWVCYRLFRLRGWGRFDAVLSMIAHYKIGTPMYMEPPNKRLRRKSEVDMLNAANKMES